MRRIATTLEALASYGSDNPNPMRGRLTGNVDSPGFGALSALAPSSSDTREREAKELLEEEAALAGARAALAKATKRSEAAEAALEGARAAVTRAAEEVDRAASGVEEARAVVAELDERRRSRLKESREAAD